MKHAFKVIIVSCLIVSIFYCGKESAIQYPAAKRAAQVDDYHGTKVADPYRWLEDMNSADTAQWIAAQQQVTEQYFAKITFRARLKDRLTQLWNHETYTTPRKEGVYYVYRKNDGLLEQSVLYIQEGLQGEPQVLLDPNTFSEDGSVSLTTYSFSRDQKYLGYGISRGGSDWREYFVMDVAKKERLPDHLKWIKFSNLSWYKEGFFYSRYQKPEQGKQYKAKVESQELYYHRLGSDQSQDKLIYRDKKNPRLGFRAEVTENEKYLVLDVWEDSSDYNYIYYKNLETDAAVVPVIGQSVGHFEFVAEVDDKFLVCTDFLAPNYRLVLIDPAHPEKENWKEIIPEAKDKLSAVSLLGGKLIASYLQDAFSKVTVFDLSGKKLHDIGLPGIGTVYGFRGSKDEQETFYSFESFTVPDAIYRYDSEKNESHLFKRARVGFDPQRFETSQVFYQSKDKTRVPMFILHQKGLQKDGRNPTLLYAYGGFNSSTRPHFSEHIIPLLENGGVYAAACLRGGGEYGEEWHQAGMLEKKQNVFDDFIAAAEYLIREGYTSPGKLAIRGASNGGLLVGAVINQRSDLFKVAIPQVGVMDMLRFHKFTIGWAWTGEYGCSDNPDHFKFLYAYSPLHNIKAGLDYPATLVTTADRDDRVFPAHSFKYIATLQEKASGENPLLIRIEKKAGHGGASGTSRRIALYADIYAFMFYNMGIEPKFPD